HLLRPGSEVGADRRLGADQRCVRRCTRRRQRERYGGEQGRGNGTTACHRLAGHWTGPTIWPEIWQKFWLGSASLTLYSDDGVKVAPAGPGPPLPVNGSTWS